MLLRVLGILLAVIVVASTPASADGVGLRDGRVVGGVVENGGDAFFLVSRRTVADGSFIARLTGEQLEFVELPEFQALSLTTLVDGRLLLRGFEGPYDTKGNLAHAMKIVKPGGEGGMRHFKSHRHRASESEGSHAVPIVVSGDGKAWGIVDDAGTGFVFGRTMSRKRVARTETAEVGSARDAAVSDFKWTMAPDFVFLDSDGPVVLTPWSGGAYILHFRENGSAAYTVPILFDGGVEEYDFRWQWEERVLWARTSLYWKAYHLWDLGLSPMSEEPFWVVERSSAEPHPERGIVRVVSRQGGYSIEHLWRDPWSGVEERQVSDLYQGQTPLLIFIAADNEVFVSPNGRHAVVVEARRAEEGDTRTYARRVDLRLAPPLPPLEPDREAEILADRKAMPWLRVQAATNQAVPSDVEADVGDTTPTTGKGDSEAVVGDSGPDTEGSAAVADGFEADSPPR